MAFHVRSILAPTTLVLNSPRISLLVTTYEFRNASRSVGPYPSLQHKRLAVVMAIDARPSFVHPSSLGKMFQLRQLRSVLLVDQPLDRRTFDVS